MDALAIVHPAVLVALLALLAWALPRALGHALGVVGLLAVVGLSWLMDGGQYLQVELFGVFEAVLYNIDPFSRLMGIVFGIVGAVAVLYAWYSEADSAMTGLALTYVSASLGAVFAGDWLTLILGWELMAITSTLLVWQHRSPGAVRSGYRYAVFHGIGGSLLLAAVVWQFVETGSMIFAEGMAAGGPALLAALGIGVNVGFVGLHTWLPDTYPSPHFAASVFLCAYTTKTGAYTMYRAFPEGNLWIAYMGGTMALFGALAAVLQTDMRRLLSYSIQSQVGYIIAGIGIGSTIGTAGAFGHIFNHILYKALLFMVVGVIIYRTGKERLDAIGGLAREMPITAATFAVAAFSIVSFPGFNGFISKGMILYAASHGGGAYEELWILLLVTGVGTFLALLKLGYFAFIQGSYAGRVRDANAGQTVAMGAVAALCVIAGVWPDTLYALMPGATTSGLTLLPFGEALTTPHYTSYTVGHILEIVALGVVALLIFAVTARLLARLAVPPDIDWILNRVTFYGTRLLARGVTGLFSAIDRVAVRTARTAMAVGAAPERALRRSAIGNRLLAPTAEYTHPLRPGIGAAIGILVAVTTAFLLLAVV